jgi:ABC-type thiamine transport system ATPase subunit
VFRSAKTDVELRDLVWAAGKSYCLDHDPFRISGGETGVIIAADAAGTALADVLLGLARPSRGLVYVRGVPVEARPPGRSGIALVPTGGGLLPHLTVERNVGFGLGGKVTGPARQAQVVEVLGKLQLTSLRRMRPHELSPDQRLRVAVARAICTPAGTAAVVVEDRGGRDSCRVAVMTAAEQELAVLVITSMPGRAAEFPYRVQASCQLLQPSGDRTDATQP